MSELKKKERQVINAINKKTIKNIVSLLCIQNILLYSMRNKRLKLEYFVRLNRASSATTKAKNGYIVFIRVKRKRSVGHCTKRTPAME